MLRQMARRPSSVQQDRRSHPVEAWPPRPQDRVVLPRGTAKQQNDALLSQQQVDEHNVAAMASIADAFASPSPPPLCTSNCIMVPAAANTYFQGTYHAPNSRSAHNSTAACETACVLDPHCVAMTFSTRPDAPCEIYTTVTRRVFQAPDTVVALKCAKGQAVASKCGHFTKGTIPPPGPTPSPILPPGIRYHAVMEGIQVSGVELLAVFSLN